MLRAVGDRSRARTPRPPLRAALAVLALVAGLPFAASAQTPAGTSIDNQATATYDLGAALGLIQLSNLHSTIVAPLRTPASAELLQHAPAAPGAQNVIVPASRCSSTGLVAGPFNPVPPPVQLDGTPIALPGPVDLLAAAQYTLGAPVFVRLADADQDLDPTSIDTVLVLLATAADSELLELTETGIASGVFTGHIQSAEAAAAPNDCVLQGASGGSAVLSYTDPADPTDTAGASAALSPVSRVFDAGNGGLLDGVSVSLVDDASGLPAAVFGDDGVSAFPATVTTGGTFSDGVKTYVFAPGTYRFPYVPAGTYRLVVVPPAGYLAPSAVADAVLQGLPGAPFALSPASRGLAFSQPSAGAIDVDVPLDPSALLPFLVKTASEDVVGIGDFLQYNLQVRNPGAGAAPAGILLSDRLPQGFRYRAGSARLNDAPVADPVQSGDGRTLTFTLPATAGPEVQNVRYVLEVTSGTPLGDATNHARADVIGGAQSFEATATVIVREELFSSSTFLMGRVAIGGCNELLGPDTPGLEGVRVYLEDGTYTVSDENGFFHFDGIDPGVHVVQLDRDSLPVQYEPVPCTQNTRFAGRSFSQFVDVQGGTLWRTDFRVALRAPEQGYVNSQLRTRLEDGRAHFEVELRGSGVPVRDVRVMSLLPEGVAYEPGTSRLDGEAIADPERAENVLTHRLDSPDGRWTRVLTFEGRVESGEDDLRLQARSFAMFRTPTAPAARTPVAQAILLQDSRSASDVQVVETVGLLPGSEWPEDAAPEPEDAAPPEPVHDMAWLEQQEPRLAWLAPAPGFAPEIPSTKIAIQHDAAHQITLLLNGQPVSDRNRSGLLRSRRGAALSTWSGVDLAEGPNRFEAVARDADGREVGRLEHALHYAGPPVRVELAPEASTLLADGRTTPVIALRLRDRWGMPARKGVIGEFSVNRPYEPARSKDSPEARRILELDPARPTFTVAEDGIARVELRPISQAGKVELRLPLQGPREHVVTAWLEPEDREWVLVGLAEGTLAYRNLSGNMQELDALGIDEHGDLARRMSLFAKGRIQGKWLLTLAYDSRADEDDEHEGLDTIIDPNRYYTLYGGKSEQQEEAPTREKLYLKLERSQFYALFGDYDTALDVTEFSRYDRDFTGFKTEYEGDVVSFSGFAADTHQGFIRDEIRGEGISGLYRLSRGDVELGSEKVRIETRDRFKTEVVLASRELVRHADYNIDYAAGTLYFSTPVPSKDEQFNPVFIVAEYESEDDKDRSIIAGGRGALHLMDDRLELGASAIHEGRTGQDGGLLGGDLRFELDDHTSFRGEYAGTKTDPLGVDRQGAAWLAELQRSGERFSGRAYIREQDQEYGLGQQSQLEQGTRKLGLESSWAWSDSLRLNGQAYRQEVLETGAERDVLETRADWAWSPATSLYGGYRMARDSGGGNPDALSHQLLAGGAWSTLGDRLRLRLGSELALGGNDENPDFPTRLLLGADYELTPNVVLFAEQELTFGDAEDTRGSRIGFRASPWQGGQVTSSLSQLGSSAGPASFANLGLAQTWQVNDRWSMEGAFDSSHTLHDPGAIPLNANVPPASGSATGDFSAVSLGSTYRSDAFAWTGRVETRSGDLENKWGFFTGFVREVDRGVGYSLTLEYFDSDASAGTETRDTDLRLGFVWRRPNSRWIVLNRLDLSAEEQDGPTFGIDARKVVNNVNVNFQWTPRLQVSLQYGAKYVSDAIDGESYDGYIDIWGIELRRDLSDRWDLGLAARVRSSWKADVVESSWGAELGYELRKNLWVSAGYNFGGFRDDDFPGADYTSAGPYVKFRYKFDQQTIRELLDWESYPARAR